jgi:hypothetical protein
MPDTCQSSPSLSEYIATVVQSLSQPQLLSLLRLPLCLGQSPLPYVLMHGQILRQSKIPHRARKRPDDPQKEAMTPPRRARIRYPLRAATAPDLGERSGDELARRGHHGAGAANLAHGARDEMALDDAHVDAGGGEPHGPVLQEGLAAGVGRQQRGREDAAEGGHGEYQAAAAGDEEGRDERRHAQRRAAVDGDDAVHLGARRLEERHGDRVGLADVVDEHGHVEPSQQRTQRRVVGVPVLRKVHGQDFGPHAGVCRLELGIEGFELGARARDEHEVEAFARQLQGEFAADAVGRARDDGPGALGAVFGELEFYS